MNYVFRTRQMIVNVNTGENINKIIQYVCNQSIEHNLRYRFSKGEKFTICNAKEDLEEVERAGGE